MSTTLERTPATMNSPAIQHTQCFINNQRVDAVSGNTFATINPATEAEIA